MVYKCNYCGASFDKRIHVCSSCGASDIIQLTDDGIDYKSLSAKQKVSRLPTPIKIILGLFVVPTIVIIIITVTIFSIAFVHVLNENEDSEPTQKVTTTANGDTVTTTVKSKSGEREFKYSKDLYDNPDAYLGQDYTSVNINYNYRVTVTGDYDELCDIKENIYSRQFSMIEFSIPTQIEFSTDDYSIDVSEIKFDYYSQKCYVLLKLVVSDKINGSFDMYLVDEDGAKNKLVLQSYDAKEYSNVKDFINAKPWRCEFEISGVFTEYDYIIFRANGEEYKFELNYDKAKGKIEYYGLK